MATYSIKERRKLAACWKEVDTLILNMQTLYATQIAQRERIAQIESWFVTRLLKANARPTSVCENVRCGKKFVIKREARRFCSAKCSRRQRQRQYWAKTGTKMRKRRIAKRTKTA